VHGEAITSDFNAWGSVWVERLRQIALIKLVGIPPDFFIRMEVTSASQKPSSRLAAVGQSLRLVKKKTAFYRDERTLLK
jgi:hypothetical protein